jgi:hypothetical protein
MSRFIDGAFPAMTDVERASVTSLLAESRDALHALVDGLTDDQWHAPPRPEAWSPIEVLDHLAITERAVLVLLTERLPKRPPAPPDRRSTVDDEKLVRITEDRGQGLEAPDRMRPQGSMTSPAELLAAFDADRAVLLRYAGSTTDDLRARLAPHPIAGLIDAYQWLLFLGAHTKRHTAQVAESARR